MLTWCWQILWLQPNSSQSHGYVQTSQILKSYTIQVSTKVELGWASTWWSTPAKKLKRSMRSTNCPATTQHHLISVLALCKTKSLSIRLASLVSKAKLCLKVHLTRTSSLRKKKRPLTSTQGSRLILLASSVKSTGCLPSSKTWSTTAKTRSIDTYLEVQCLLLYWESETIHKLSRTTLRLM